jgi:hypothetical protein
MELSHLVYVSSAIREMSDDDLLEILNTAREFNKAQNISGVLLYRDGFFIQVLEGDYAKVQALFEGISQDSRHQNVIKLYHEAIEQRKFGQWAMGFMSPDFMKLKEFEGFSDFMDPQQISISSATAQKVEDYIEFVLENFRRLSLVTREYA